MTQNLPFDAVVFDLDGVITQTAKVHSVAWKEMFDHYLKQREEKYNEPFKAFTHEGDYLTYVDGKPRYQGVQSFLESRGIDIPYGDPEDSPEMETACGIGNLKNKYFNEILQRDGIEVYPSTVDLIHQLKEMGVKVGVASSSKNCELVLNRVNLSPLVETRVDGVVSAKLGLKGKPEADIFTTAADNLGVTYHRTIVVEDAISGVQAGAKGNFGLVLGLAREDNHRELKINGADIVVSDISELDLDDLIDWFENGLVEDGWSLTYNDYIPEKERSREALLSVGNGYYGTRGSMEEQGINEINYPGTYMSGVFNRLVSKVADREIENEDFVNTINWLPITFKIDNGPWLDMNNTKLIEIERKLDFKSGVLYKVMTVSDDEGRITKIYTRRFASMNNPNIGGIHYCLSPTNYSATITYKSTLSGNHINAGVKRYGELNQQHLEAVKEEGFDQGQFLQVKTTQSQIYISAMAKLEVLYNGEPMEAIFDHDLQEAKTDSTFAVELEIGEYLGLMKTVYMKNSHDLNEIPAFDELYGLMNGFEEEMKASEKRWSEIWNKIDIQISGDRLTQKLIRMHQYHLMSGTSEHNKEIDFGIPARGLTGEAYRGHIFWDELYILPFYFIHYPEVAKSILMYRYRRLDKARAYAKEHGYQGAMFPWQSGSDGREETQKFHYNPISGKWGDDRSSLQRHVSLAIAYNIIQYYKFTEDKQFMLNHGMEMLLEIGRFWQSKTSYCENCSKYIIDKVMGPDEFHEAYPGSEEGGLKNNAYTNLMTVWMWDEIQDICKVLPTEKLDKLFTQLSFDTASFEKWNTISSKLKLEISDDSIIAQHEGYFDLKELDWDYYKNKYADIHRMDRVLKAEGESPDAYKVAKQADMLMTFYNLDNEKVTQILEQMGYSLAPDYIERNLDYYLQRTSHGSTLSRVVHAYLASQLHRFDLSWKMYHEAVNSDYNDIQGGTTAEGIHTGVMAGTIWILLSTFAGLSFEKKLSINPMLPAHWTKLSFSITYKGVEYDFKLSKDEIELESSAHTNVTVNGKEVSLIGHEVKKVSLID
jgi:beta-phosphoglucomutase family hydrolase